VTVASHRFSSVRELLAGVASDLAQSTGSTAALAPVWDEAVGPQLARNARPVSFDHGALIVEAVSRSWADAVTLREAQVRAALAPKLKVSRLVVRVKA
jgi:predicted nucleic acid-binding Zn ribbon protein